MKKFKWLAVGVALLGFIVPSKNVQAEEITTYNDKYKIVKYGDINKVSRAIYSLNSNEEELEEEVKEKLECINDYPILIKKTSSKFEVALAYEDGSYSFVEEAETIEDSMEIIDRLEKQYNTLEIIPAVINEDGQVVYSTNSMGRIWNHRNGSAVSGISLNTLVYSNSSLTSEYTYINQGYVDDVPIISDNGTSAKIQVNGYTGWVNSNKSSGNYDLVVVPINQATNPSYYYVQNGMLYHYISYNLTGNSTNGNHIRIGKAPSYLKTGIEYYSYDGIYFYTGSSKVEGLNKLINDLKNNTVANSVNPSNPNYTYFQNLPYRTKTSFTASELNSFINNNTDSDSKLRNLGSVLIECENKYGVNALIILATAIHESGWGKSSIALSKNNLFGINAVDFSPGQSADSFSSPQECVREFAKTLISRGYSDPADWRYYGGYVGNKKLGANVKYASDPFWGEKIAQHAFSIDYELSGNNVNTLRDNDGYQLVLYTGANTVTKSDGTLLYNVNATVSGWGSYAGNVAALKFPETNSAGRYQIFPERNTAVNNGGDANKYHGNYNWNDIGTISKSNVKFINTPKSVFIPGYEKADINKDGFVDILDLSTLGLNYNNTSSSSSFKKYYDVNSDNIIDIYDMTIIGNKIK